MKCSLAYQNKVTRGNKLFERKVLAEKKKDVLLKSIMKRLDNLEKSIEMESIEMENFKARMLAIKTGIKTVEATMTSKAVKASNATKTIRATRTRKRNNHV